MPASPPGSAFLKRMTRFGIILAAFAGACDRCSAPETPLSADGSPRILVRKSERRLILYRGERVVLETRVALGGVAGHKEREGDRRTPEGDYTVCTRNDKSRFHLFLGLSYPGIADAAAGLRDGRLTREQHDQIVRSIRAGKQPPWNTPLGGEVGIHGHGAGRDWTLGCIALEDADVDVLWRHCPLGTPVRIEP